MDGLCLMQLLYKPCEISLYMKMLSLHLREPHTQSFPRSTHFASKWLIIQLKNNPLDILSLFFCLVYVLSVDS